MHSQQPIYDVAILCRPLLVASDNLLAEGISERSKSSHWAFALYLSQCYNLHNCRSCRPWTKSIPPGSIGALDRERAK